MNSGRGLFRYRHGGGLFGRGGPLSSSTSKRRRTLNHPSRTLQDYVKLAADLHPTIPLPAVPRTAIAADTFHNRGLFITTLSGLRRQLVGDCLVIRLGRLRLRTVLPVWPEHPAETVRLTRTWTPVSPVGRESRGVRPSRQKRLERALGHSSDRSGRRPDAVDNTTDRKTGTVLVQRGCSEERRSSPSKVCQILRLIRLSRQTGRLLQVPTNGFTSVCGSRALRLRSLVQI